MKTPAAGTLKSPLRLLLQCRQLRVELSLAAQRKSAALLTQQEQALALAQAAGRDYARQRSAAQRQLRDALMDGREAGLTVGHLRIEQARWAWGLAERTESAQAAVSAARDALQRARQACAAAERARMRTGQLASRLLEQERRLVEQRDEQLAEDVAARQPSIPPRRAR